MRKVTSNRAYEQAPEPADDSEEDNFR